MVHTYHDDSEPSPERFYHLDRTIKHPEEVISRLKSTKLGNLNHPTKVNVSDLKVDISINDTKSKGII